MVSSYPATRRDSGSHTEEAPSETVGGRLGMSFTAFRIDMRSTAEWKPSSPSTALNSMMSAMSGKSEIVRFSSRSRLCNMTMSCALDLFGGSCSVRSNFSAMVWTS